MSGIEKGAPANAAHIYAKRDVHFHHDGELFSINNLSFVSHFC